MRAAARELGCSGYREIGGMSWVEDRHLTKRGEACIHLAGFPQDHELWGRKPTKIMNDYGCNETTLSSFRA